jgi:hypothetical protein
MILSQDKFFPTGFPLNFCNRFYSFGPGHVPSYLDIYAYVVSPNKPQVSRLHRLYFRSLWIQSTSDFWQCVE